MQKNTSRLKIAFVLDDGLDSEDGVQQYILTLGRWMEQNGHEVHYLVGETRRTDIKNIHSLAKNIKVAFNGNKLTIPLPAKKSRIKRHLETENYDVLHIQVPYSPFFAAKVVRFAPESAVVIGTFHILPYGWLARSGTGLLGFWLRSNLKRFDVHLSVSKTAQIFAKQTFEIDSRVIPNTVDLSRYTPKQDRPENRPLRVVFLGRLVPRKGCQYFLQALSSFKKKYPEIDFRADVCGKGPLKESLEKYVLRNGLESNVVFRGFVSEEEKIGYMQNADLAVFPAYGGESFGIVLIEAMACGSGVVLAGDNPGYKTVMPEIPEVYFDPKHTDNFSLKLYEFLADSIKRLEVHARQAEIVKRYSIETVGSQIINVYQDCKKAKAGK